MQVTEFLAQNKSSWWLKIKSQFKTNCVYRISFAMLLYWLLINVILFSLINVLSNPWSIISGFNLGFSGGFVGFLLLGLASKWRFAKGTIRQALSYFSFLLRMVVYGLVIALAIYFNAFNLFSLIGGLSLLVLATITSEFLSFKQVTKEKASC